MALSLRLQRPDEQQPRIRLASAPAQTISIRQSQPAPAQTISRQSIQPAQSVQRTAMPQMQQQFKVPTVNPQMPQTQQIRLPKMNQPKVKQPQINPLQQFGNAAGNLGKQLVSGIQQAGGNVADAVVMGGAVLDDTAGALRGDSDVQRAKTLQRYEKVRDAIKGAKTITGESLNRNPDYVATGDAMRDVTTLAGRGLSIGNDATMFINPTRLLSGAVKPTGVQLAKFVGRDAGFFGATAGTAEGLQEYGRSGDVGKALEVGGKTALMSAGAQIGLEGGAKALNVGANATGKAVERAQQAPHIRTLEHPAVQDVKAHADLLFQQKQTLIDRGLSPTSPAVKQLDNAIRNTGKLYNDTYKTVYEAQTQGGSVPAGMFDPTGKLGKQTDVPKQDLIIKNGDGKAMSVEPKQPQVGKTERLYHGTGRDFKQFGIDDTTREVRKVRQSLLDERNKLVETGKIEDGALSIPKKAQDRMKAIDKEIATLDARTDILPSSVKEKGVYFTSDKKYAKTFAGKDGKIVEADVELNNPYIIKNKDEMDLIEDAAYYPNIIEDLESQGYDGIKAPDGQVLVFDPKKATLAPAPKPTLQDALAGKSTKIAPKAAKEIKMMTLKTAEGKNEYVAQLGNSVTDRVGKKTGFKAESTSPNFKTEGEMNKWIKENSELPKTDQKADIPVAKTQVETPQTPGSKTTQSQQNALAIRNAQGSSLKISQRKATPQKTEGKTELLKQDNQVTTRTYPDNTTNEVKKRGFTETVKGSDEVSSEVRRKVSGEYNVRSTDNLAVNADTFSKGGLKKVSDDVNSRLDQKLGTINDQDVADAIAVAKRHDAKGNFNESQAIYDKLAEHGTKGGQMIDTSNYDDAYGAGGGMKRITEHNQFYSDFYKANKRAPTKADYQKAITDELEKGGGSMVDPDMATAYGLAKTRKAETDALTNVRQDPTDYSVAFDGGVKPTLADALAGKSTKVKASTVASTVDQTVSPTPTAPKKQLAQKQSKQVLLGREKSQMVSETSTVDRMPETQAQTDRTYTTDSTPITDTKQYVDDMTRAQKDARKGDFNLKEKTSDFKAKFIDDLAPIEDRLNKAIKEGAQVDPKDHIRYQLDRSRRAEGITQAYINDNGLARTIQDVPNTNAFDQYLIAKHAKELDEGVKTGRNAQADQQLIDELAPEYEAYAQEIYKYNQGLLDQAVDYGLISKELAQSLKKQYPEYVPLNRVFKDDELSGVFGGKSDASISKQSAVQKIKGSNRAISSPLNSIIDKTRVVIEQGERNKAAQMLASYEKLDGNPFNLKEIPTSETIGNRSTVSFLDNGKKRTFETDPDIAEAAKHMTREQIGLWGRIAAVPARVLRAGATGVNAGFAGANVVKDIIGSAINSQHGMRVADPRSLGKGLAAALNHNGKYYQELMREGVAGTSFDMYRNPNKMNVGEIRSQKNLGTRAAYNITHPGQWYRTLENSIGRSEDFGRSLQYYSNKDGYRAKGMNESDVKLLAGDQARYNATNFFRSGSYGKGINLAVPYWNAGVQGARIQVRRIKERPVQTVAKMGFAIAAPSAMIAVNNYGDEDKRAVINQIADYEKKGNIIVVGDNAKFNEQTNRWEDVYKIPVPPQHIGIHNAIQKAVESSYNGTPYDIVAALGGIAENYTTVNPTELRANANRLTPQGLKLIAEPLTNTNMYTGNSIVPFYQKDLPANEQVSKYSSLTAKTIGNLTNTSPRMIDNAIRTGAGGAGQNAVNIIDNGLAAAGVGKKDEVRGKSLTSSITDRFVGANQKQDDKKSAKVVADEKAAKKKADTGWMDEYKAAKSSFEKESKNWTTVERAVKQKELAKLEVKKEYSKEITSMYDMAAKDIYGLLDSLDEKEANKYLTQAVSYADKMVEKGLWTSNKLRDKYGNIKYDRNYNTKTASGTKTSTRSTGTRKASTGRKVASKGTKRSAKGKFDYKLFGFSKDPTAKSQELYGLLKKAKMKSSTA